MKKIAGLSILMTFCTLSAANAASTGTITFNGELTATTCDVSVDGKGPSATVVLPTLGTNQLQSPGDTGGRTNFNMELSNCSGTLKTASAFFEAGPTVDLTTGRLNTTGAASNLQLQLRDGADAAHRVIRAGDAAQATNNLYTDVSSGSATLPYEVEYYATGATSPGDVVSSVVYSIQYK